MEFTETEHCKKAMQTFPNKDGHLQSARIALTFFPQWKKQQRNLTEEYAYNYLLEFRIHLFSRLVLFYILVSTLLFFSVNKNNMEIVMNLCYPICALTFFFFFFSQMH